MTRNELVDAIGEANVQALEAAPADFSNRVLNNGLVEFAAHITVHLHAHQMHKNTNQWHSADCKCSTNPDALQNWVASVYYVQAADDVGATEDLGSLEWIPERYDLA